MVGDRGFARLIAAFAIVVTLLTPIATIESVRAQTTPPTGDLVIYLESDDGLVPNACYAITDSLGNILDVCDEDGDGVASLDGVYADTSSSSRSPVPMGI